jgi:hypothetical protein
MLLAEIRQPFFKLKNDPNCRITDYSGHLQTVDEVVAYSTANHFSRRFGQLWNNPIIELKKASIPERFLPLSSDWQAYLLRSMELILKFLILFLYFPGYFAFSFMSSCSSF